MFVWNIHEKTVTTVLNFELCLGVVVHSCGTSLVLCFRRQARVSGSFFLHGATRSGARWSQNPERNSRLTAEHFRSYNTSFLRGFPAETVIKLFRLFSPVEARAVQTEAFAQGCSGTHKSATCRSPRAPRHLRPHRPQPSICIVPELWANSQVARWQINNVSASKRSALFTSFRAVVARTLENSSVISFIFSLFYLFGRTYFCLSETSWSLPVRRFPEGRT